MADIKQGQIVFNRAGIRAKYEGSLNGIHYVTPEVIIYGWEGEEQSDWGEPTAWPEVFPKAPALKLQGEIAELDQRVLAKRGELQAVEADIRQQNKDQAEFLKRLDAAKTNNEVLANLMDFIDGKITHVVAQTYGEEIYTIKTLQEMEETEDDYKRTRYLPLVSLFGRSGGNLSYGINRWKDGSGSDWRTIFPCRSLEEAEEKIANLIRSEGETHFDLQRSGNGNTYLVDRYVVAFRKHGFEVPTDISAGHEARYLEGFNRRKADLEKQLSDHMATLRSPA